MVNGRVLEVLAPHAPFNAFDALKQRLEDVLNIGQLRTVHELGQGLQAIQQKFLISDVSSQMLLHSEVDLAVDEEGAGYLGLLGVSFDGAHLQQG